MIAIYKEKWRLASNSATFLGVSVFNVEVLEPKTVAKSVRRAQNARAF